MCRAAAPAKTSPRETSVTEPPKTVLCFGDSLTWGFVPGTGGRLPFAARWPGVAQARLGPGVRVVEEALNGRTTVWDDTFLPGRNGRAVLPVLLESHSPLDLVVLLLGINDIQPYRRLGSREVGRGAGVLIDLVRQGPPGPRGVAPEVLLVSPPPLGTPRGWMVQVFEGGEEQSRGLAASYRAVAENRRCRFFDAGGVTRASEADGVHLDEAGQLALGNALAEEVRRILGISPLGAS
jgi:lysophospholipase L1-like esterase